MIITVLSFLVILSVLVLIHEFGHFITAKLFGIKVEEFGLGFPPKALTLFTKGDTAYTLNWLPIGGFVKMFGEDEAGAGRINVKSQKNQVDKGELKKAFFNHPVWQRAIVVASGVIMNFLFAWVILSFLSATLGVLTPQNNVIIAEVANNSPASKSGLQVGDQILSVNGQKVTSPQELILLTKKDAGQLITLTILPPEKGKVTNISLTPRKNPPKGQGAIGIALGATEKFVKTDWYKALFEGLRQTVQDIRLMYEGLGTLIAQLLTHGSVPQGIAGPIGIAQLTGQEIKAGWYAVLELVALLSINLAVVNILPVPALDGGRLFLIIVEGIIGKKLPLKVEARVQMIGMIFLFALILLITLHDIYRIVSGQPLLPQ